MSELGSVLSFLEKSRKGRLEYDRDWAKSPESVHRMLHELSLGFSGLEIKPATDRQIRVAAYSPENVIIESDDNILLTTVNDNDDDGLVVRDEVLLSSPVSSRHDDSYDDDNVVGSPESPPPGFSYSERLKRTTHFSERRRLVYSPVDELLQETFSQRPPVISNKSTTTPLSRSHHVPEPRGTIISNRVVENNKKNTAMSTKDHEDEKSPYFGVRPVHVRVNRREEVDLNDSEQLKDYRSPVYRRIQSVQDNILQLSDLNTQVEQHTVIVETKDHKTDVESILEYREGFIRSVADSQTMSAEAVMLKLDSVRHLVGLPSSEEGEEEKKKGKGGTGRKRRDLEETLEVELQEEKNEVDEAESDNDEDEHGDGDGEVERQLASMMERMRGETEKKNSEIIKKFEDNSARLAEEAERRYREEMEEIRRLHLIQANKLEADKQDELKKAEREREENEAMERARREETKLILQKYQEQEDKIREELEREQRIKEQSARYERLMPGLKKSIMSLLDLWSSIEDKSKFSETSTEVAGSLHSEFSSGVDNIKTKISSGAALQEDWDSLARLETNIQHGVKQLKEDIERIKQEAAKAVQEAAKEAAKAKEAEAAAAKAAKEPSPPAAQPPQQQPTPLPATTTAPEVPATAFPTSTQPVAVVQPASATPGSGAGVPSAASSSGGVQPKSASEYYLEILDFKTKYVEDVVFADTEKKIKSELTLGISTALNAISAQTKEHLNDKLAKLALLLAGKPVTMKDIQICASQHKFGVKYCTALLAKKIVRQGEDVVCSKAEAAFPIAGVALALWDTFPDFGKLLQAYFFEFCPFLAPHSPPKLDGQSDKDYFTSLGYRFEKDGIEKQDKYLKRMTGLARLYSAITAVAKPQGSQSTVHPQGPGFMWRYLINLLNLAPLPDVTATILLVVLETTGHVMVQQYQDQYLKLLSSIKLNFLPALEAVKTDGGPTSRLDMFLTKALAEKSVEKPKGSLSPGFIQKVNV